VFGALLLMAMTFLTSRSSGERLRIVLIAAVCAVMGGAFIIALLSIGDVASLFKERASLEQSYDLGHLGRFGRYILGFEPAWHTDQLTPWAALGKSAGDNWRAGKATITFLPRLFTGEGRKNVSGVVGITDVYRQAIGLNFALFLAILGLISLSLALLNLLPLLPLDGGHILFSIIEGIRGRAVGREIYERVSALGIALFLVLMFIGLSNDLSRIGG